MAVVIPVIVLAAMVFVLVDIITRDESQMKHLPKVVWVLLVVLVPLIGAVLWFAIGREYSGPSSSTRLSSPARPRGRADSPPPHSDIRSTEQQMADLDREIEYYRLQAELERRKRDAEGDPSA